MRKLSKIVADKVNLVLTHLSPKGYNSQKSSQHGLEKGLWILLLVFSSVAGACFLGKAALASWSFYQLNTQIPAQIASWEVVELSDSKYTLKACYSFAFSDKTYQGVTQFSKDFALNRFAAERDLKWASEQRWKVWVNSHNPAYSSLEKQLPFKSFAYGLMCLGIFGYFLYRFKKQIENSFVES